MNKGIAFIVVALLVGGVALLSIKRNPKHGVADAVHASPRAGAAPLVVEFTGLSALGKQASFSDGDGGSVSMAGGVPPKITHVYWKPGVFKAGAPGKEIEVKVEGSRVSPEFEAKEAELKAKFTGEGSGSSRGFCRLGNLNLFTVEAHDAAKAETWYFGDDFRPLGDATFQMRPPGEPGGPVHTGGAFIYDPKECHAP